MEKFPELFDYLSRNNDNASRDMFQVLDIFEKEESLAEISNWLKDLPSVKGPRQTCGTLVLEEEIIAELEKVVDANDPNEGRKQIVMQVRPHLLYKPNLFQGSSMPDDRAKHFLFDRVVNVREGFSVPLGLRGTITGNQSFIIINIIIIR